ncbi:hypothetical protein ACQ4M3_42045 [Leptolyngbya sp. AN03gr2]|uniref:hypothetical protein n=1 Tax=unclassified Leptolyngbya TaxID=2650499 RepID=UPI003D31BEB8
MKWNAAVYQTSDGNWQTVCPANLHDIGFRAFLRGQELWSVDKEKRLFIRYRVDTPHFYALSNRVPLVVDRQEALPRHNERIKQLLMELQQPNLKFGYYDYTEDGRVFFTIFKSEQYVWSQEVFRTHSNIVWRHDIFGANAGHRLSEHTPWVAIEVIDTHFPEDRAFDAWLRLSSEFPCLVLFDFVEEENYYFHIIKTTQQVRFIYYIYEGAVWKSRKQLPSCNAAMFKEKLTAELSAKRFNRQRRNV